MGQWNYDQLHADIVAVYTAQLPIPPWWPAEDRAAFISAHAGEAANSLIVQLDDIVDRNADLAYRDIDGQRFSADEIAALTAAEQDTLLTEARTTVLWDLADAIAEQSASLTAEATFTHPPRGQSRDVTHQPASLCAITSRLQPTTME